MKIAVFGAGGRTGILLVFQALKEGHHVTAFARNANKITIRHEHLRVVEGDVMNEEKVREAVEGCDAVLCTLGADRRNPGTI